MDSTDLELERLRREAASKDVELALRRRCQAALQAISEAIGAAPTVAEEFERALHVLQQLTGHANMALRLYIPELHCLKLMAQVGMTPEMVEELACLSADWGMMGDVVREKKPIFTTDMPAEPDRVGATAPRAGYQSIVSVPLLAGERLIGTMEFASKDAHLWSEDELGWLALLGRIVGINVQHVQLTEQVHNLAIVQERARLAQEMHDGLGQMLSTIHVWADEAQLALDSGDATAAQVAVARIDASAQDAYNVLREEILGLRMAISPGQELIPLLRKYLDRFQRQWHIVTNLALPAGAEQGRLGITPAQEIQLLRVVQEALTNVRRHARATQVTLSITESSHAVSLVVADNGVGFDPAAVGDDRLGLRIMRERVSGIGGDVHIESEPGRGATVRVRLPKAAPGAQGGSDGSQPAAG